MSNLDKYKSRLLAMHKQMCTGTLAEKHTTKEYHKVHGQFLLLVGAMWVNENVPNAGTNIKTYLEIISEEELSRVEMEIKQLVESN